MVVGWCEMTGWRLIGGGEMDVYKNCWFCMAV